MQLSPDSKNFIVSLKGDICMVGCRAYRASKLLTSLKVLIMGEMTSHSVFSLVDNKIVHNNQNISIEDAKTLITYLESNNVRPN